jgi:hypothetical protein
VVITLVVAVIAIPLLTVGRSVRSALSVPTVNFGQGSGPASGEPSPPRPAQPVSYLNPAGLRAGLAHVATLDPGARLTLLRVDAASLSVTATLPNGVAKLIYFGPTGTHVTAGAATGQRPIPISQIRPGVVGRLVAEMGRRFHVAPNQIDYMVLSSPPMFRTQWVVFSKAPGHPGYAATLTGTNLTPLSR